MCMCVCSALLDDWLGDEEADLLNFVPYNWRINVDLLNYEIFLFTNRYNWVDIAPDGIENSELPHTSLVLGKAK